MAAHAVLVLILLAAGSPSTAIREESNDIAEDDGTNEVRRFERINKLENKASTYQLHAGLERQHVFSNTANLLAPSIEIPKADLYADPAAIDELLRNSKKGEGPQVYEALLKSQLDKRKSVGKCGPDGAFCCEGACDLDAMRTAQVNWVKQEYTKLLCPSKESPPTANFVTGETAVGKSSFLKNKANIPDRTVHVNADDIRAMMVGNYETYVIMSGNRNSGSGWEFDAEKIVLPGPMYQDANKIRFWVQDQVFEHECNFLADSLTVPAVVISKFATAGFTTKAYYLEVGFKGTDLEGQAADFDKKVELSRSRIRDRMTAGGHSTASAKLMADGQIKKTRTQMATAALNVPVPITFYISQARDYDAVEWPNILDMECKTSVDAA